MNKRYDAIIIGAGMSGLAAGIRLAMYNKKVCILEKHIIPGGLNSYYKRGKREFDVGLHAMTNFVPKGSKRKPLTKLFKQLRIPYDEFQLGEQFQSKIAFPEVELKFSNNIELLESEINQNFPDQIDGWIQLRNKIENFDEVSLENEFLPAKEVVKNFISNETLREMIFCPLLIYGSAWENDMDFSQFAIMFKSIFLEGFSRPKGGVRTILNHLTEKFENLGGELLYRHEVVKIEEKNGKACGVHLKNGEFFESDCIFSSMGLPETIEVLEGPKDKADIGKLSFTEVIACLDKKPKDLGIDETIIFYNNNPTYEYRRPNELYDNSSAVICFSNNFEHDDFNEGIVRITNMANPQMWNQFARPEYKEQKELLFNQTIKSFEKFTNGEEYNVLFKDVFTPKTIQRYTGHFDGTVYGSTDKSRKGLTSTQGLYIIGTDQGFLGIVGAMLSGISMANLYGLMD